jgi:NADH-quinone oxidoreductase subunit L
LWVAGLAGAFITALYTGRMVLLTFFGQAKTAVGHAPGKAMILPLVVLAALSTVAGFLETPHTLGHGHVFSRLLGKVFPAVPEGGHSLGLELALQVVAVAVVLAGITTAWWLYVKAPESRDRFAGSALRKWWLAGWGFDALYDFLIVRPLVAIAHWNRRDVIDSLYHGAALATRFAHVLLSHTQTGRLRWYAGGIAFGTAVLLLIALIR